MRITWVILFSLFFSELYSQESVEIRYWRSRLSYKEVNTMTVHSRQIPADVRLFFTDSMAYCYSFRMDGTNPCRNKKVIGDKLVHHGCFRNYATNEHFDEVVWPGADNYLIKDTIREYHWQFFDTHKKILKRDCAAALHVNEKNDSLLVWYTTDMPYQKGQLWYNNIPGVILQVEDQERDILIKAYRIKEHSKQIVTPREGIIVTRQQWAAIRDSLPRPKGLRH